MSTENGFWARRRQQAGQMLYRDAAMANQGFIRSIGSISSGFGFQAITEEVDGVGRNTLMFGNYGIHGHGKGQYLLRNQQGIVKHFSSIDDDAIRYALGESASTTGFKGAANRMRVRAPISTLGLPVAMSAISGAMYFKQGYDEGGIGKGVFEASKGMIKDAIIQRTVSSLLGGVAGGAVTIAAVGGYTTYSMIKNSMETSVNYKRSGRNKQDFAKPTMAMHGPMGHTMRQRAMQSMNASYFNHMRTLGNEASFMHTGRQHYMRQMDMSSHNRSISIY